MGLLDGIIPELVDNLLSPDFLGKETTVSITVSVYNPVNGTFTGKQVKTGKVKSSPPFEFSKMDIDGTIIQSGDMRLIIPKSSWDSLDTDFGAEPSKKVTVTIDGKNYSIIKAFPYYSGSFIAAHEVQLRGI